MLDRETGKELMEFESVHSAGVYVEKGKFFAHISECARGKLNTAYGYKWKFKDIKDGNK